MSRQAAPAPRAFAAALTSVFVVGLGSAGLSLVAVAAPANPAAASPAAAPAAVVAAAGAITVPTFVVAPAAAGGSLTFEGTLQAVRQSTLAAQVGGNVVALAVQAGERVRAGQVLVRLDTREQQAGLAASEAGVAQAQAQLANAQQQARRQRELQAQGFLSGAALDATEAQLRAAQAALAQAQALRAQAALGRGFTTVTAPYDAVVLATQVQAGELAMPGRPLLTLYAPGRLRAVVQLPGSAGAPARGAAAVTVLTADGRALVPLQRSELPGSDPVSQTVEWRFELAPSDAQGLLPGQPVQVRFEAAAAARAADPAAAPAAAAPRRLRVPATAVLVRGELTAVYAAARDAFVLRAVRLGARHGDEVDVLAGLQPGERIARDAVRAGLRGAVPAP